MEMTPVARPYTPYTAAATMTPKVTQSEVLLNTGKPCSRRAMKYSTVPGANRIADSRMNFSRRRRS
jgi:hypothetical protein